MIASTPISSGLLLRRYGDDFSSVSTSRSNARRKSQRLAYWRERILEGGARRLSMFRAHKPAGRRRRASIISFTGAMIRRRRALHARIVRGHAAPWPVYWNVRQRLRACCGSIQTSSSTLVPPEQILRGNSHSFTVMKNTQQYRPASLWRAAQRKFCVLPSAAAYRRIPGHVHVFGVSLDAGHRASASARKS